MKLFPRWLTSGGHIGMKPITYRGGVVTFRVPSHWTEEYDDVEGGTFYDEHSQSTLRLKVITASAPKELTSNSPVDTLRSVGSADDATIVTRGGNAYAKFEREANESGVQLRIYNWLIANPVPPKHVRVATFSYTVPESENGTADNQRVLQMLDAEIRSAQFSPSIGE